MTQYREGVEIVDHPILSEEVKQDIRDHIEGRKTRRLQEDPMRPRPRPNPGRLVKCEHSVFVRAASEKGDDRDMLADFFFEQGRCLVETLAKREAEGMIEKLDEDGYQWQMKQPLGPQGSRPTVPMAWPSGEEE